MATPIKTFAAHGRSGWLPCAPTPAAFRLVLAAWEVATAALVAAASAAAADVTRRELRGTQSSLLGQTQDAVFVLLPAAYGLILGHSERRGTDTAFLLSAALQLVTTAAAARQWRPPRA